MKPALILASFFCLFFLPAKEAKAAVPGNAHAAWEGSAHCSPHFPAVSGATGAILPQPPLLSSRTFLLPLLGLSYEPQTGAKEFRIRTGLSPPAPTRSI